MGEEEQQEKEEVEEEKEEVEEEKEEEEEEQVVEQQGTKAGKAELRRQMTRYNDAGVITSFA